MRSDSEIYSDIGKILMGIAPENATRVIMRTKLVEELDSCEYEYDYIDKEEKLGWFTGGGRANTDMLKYLVELRSWYSKNNLVGDKTAWLSCEVILDLINAKIKINFNYP